MKNISRKLPTKGLFLLLFTFLMYNCQQEAELEIAPEANLSDPLFQHLIEMGFDETEIEDYDEFYLVDGDIMFSKADFEHQLERPGTEQASTDWLVSPSKRKNIRVKIHNNLNITGADDWREPIFRAADYWNGISCKGFFINIVSSGPADITIRHDAGVLPDYVLGAGSPPMNGNPGNLIRINLNFNSNVTLQRTLCMR